MIKESLSLEERQQTPVPSDLELLKRLYRTMRLIRAFELKVEQLRTAGGLQGSAHLYVGQEAVAAGVCARLTARRRTRWKPIR